VAVVISLNNFLGPVDDTVTAQKCSTNTSTLRRFAVSHFFLHTRPPDTHALEVGAV